MNWSKLFIPTLRENPAEAEVVSHQLLLRGGYVRQLAAGIYSYLYLAQRSLLKIEAIVREEMDAMGAQEFLLPALNPAELWRESGRWEVMGDNMFRLKDRFGRELCLGMTHEEVMTSIARGELRSYKQLPQIWYQIQTKFRDEPRPKSGLLRVRQFLMKDSYSFDMEAAGSTPRTKNTGWLIAVFSTAAGWSIWRWRRIRGRWAAASRKSSWSHPKREKTSWLAASSAGTRRMWRKRFRRLWRQWRKAMRKRAAPEEVHTPGQKTIAEVSAFLGVAETELAKSVVMAVDGKPVLALLRGDHSLNEAKFAAAVGAVEFRAAQPDEIRRWFGAEPGSLGPVGVTNMLILADEALKGRRNLITGANRDDFHLRNVTPGIDFQAEFKDLRQVVEGDGCLQCGAALKIVKTVEVGHIFKLGYKYSGSMGLKVLNEAGAEVTPIMGSYGIGIERILTAAIELYHDADGMALPASIAPFEVVITPVHGGDEAQRKAAEDLYAQCRGMGIDALLDDRDERPGVKFKDADLIGIPYRITIGKKLKQGMVEVVERRTRQTCDVALGDAPARVRAGLGRG